MYARLKVFDSVWIDEQPYGTERIRNLEDLKVGDLVAFRDWDTLIASAWWIMHIEQPDDERGGTRIRFRPADDDPDPLSAGKGEDATGRFGSKPRPGTEEREPHPFYGLVLWKIEDYDWPVGYLTGEMLPTGRFLWEKIRAEQQRERDRFSMAGFCPSCGEAVTQRQHQTTFDTNLVIPDGPPVTFHIRQRCWDIGGRYQAQLKQIDRDITATIDQLETMWIEGDNDG